ncbi:MAG TPA: hypothetical protein VGM37_04230 [Armatimonadota bacterium]|jgi:hypothetical protein
MTEQVKDKKLVLTGVWEEIAARASEFAGKRVTLTVFDGKAADAGQVPSEGDPGNLAEYLGDYVGAGASGGRERLSVETGARFTDYLEGKRREGRL